MGLLDKIRSKNRGTGKHGNGPSFSLTTGLDPRRNSSARDLTLKLTTEILERIFIYLCPHSQDETYEDCETAAPDKGCCLCDSRNLAHCGRVNKRWNRLANKVLYVELLRCGWKVADL